MLKYLVAVLSVLAVVSCQQVPTKVTSQESVQGGDTQSLEQFRKTNPAILDVRSPFDFNLMHMPGAINVRWEDFSQTETRGLLQKDLFALARRLSLIGIDPSRKVMVVGQGLSGNGEEGRVAWTLQVLGVKDVRTLKHDFFREANPREANPPIENKPYWKPEVDETLFIDGKEFKKLVTQKDSGVVILDVRSAAEFMQENIAKKVQVPVVPLDWKEFFDNKGTVKNTIAKVMNERNVQPSQKILVLSNHGVRSAAVTFALRQAGFKGARNFAGGLEQWRLLK